MNITRWHPCVHDNYANGIALPGYRRQFFYPQKVPE